MLHILEKEGEVFMEMDSYDAGLVIIKLEEYTTMMKLGGSTQN